MFEYPQYEEDGQERLFFPNLWRNIESQSVTGTDCFNPNATLNNDENLIVLKMSAVEFTRMFSALYNGAVMTYPNSFMQILVNFLSGLHCPPILEEQECFDYPTYASFMGYSPMNPYLTPDEIPEGYAAIPFLIDGENGVDIPNYEHFDILVPFDALTLDVNWFEDIGGQLPQITVMVQGAGKVYVKMLSQVQGGLAVITLDNPPNLVDILLGIVTGADNIVDLNLDIVSLPPETAIEQIYEMDVAGSGIHTIYIVFLPILDDSLLPVRFGGGFRGVQLCDFVEEPELGIQNIRFEDCNLQLLQNGEWTNVTGWENLPECLPPLDCAEVETCLETSAVIDGLEGEIGTNTTNIINVTNEVTVIQEQFTQTNDVPLVSSYTGSSVCNAADYMAEQIISLCKTTWTQKGTLSLEQWLVAAFLPATGWIGQFVAAFYGAADTSYSATNAELDASKPYLINDLFCHNLEQAATITAVNADVNISTKAKAMIVACIAALTDAKFALWAFVGSTTRTGICSCVNTKIWDFTLGNQLGWVPHHTTVDRSTWVGDGFQEVTISGTGRVLVAQRGWTWPSGFQLDQVRWYISNGGTASFNYIYGMNYANGTFNGTLFGSGRWNTTAVIVQGTRVGIGVEHSIFTGGATRKLYRVEADYTGTPPSSW